MSTSKLRRIALVISSVILGTSLFAIPAYADGRGFRTLAGSSSISVRDRSRSQRVLNRQQREARILRSLNRSLERKDRSRFRFRGREFFKQDPTFSSSALRNQPSYSPTRSRARIIHVSDEMKRLAEDRAARREERLLNRIKNTRFRYYRDNEAYDERFPDIVYLDIPRK